MATNEPLEKFASYLGSHMCRSTNRNIELEVWFRIVHLTPDGHNGTPAASYREQTVEIALGPKGTIENGNIGTPKRQAPPGQVLSAVPPGRGDPKSPREPKTPRVVELLRKAIEWQSLLESGAAANQTDIARRRESLGPGWHRSWACCAWHRRFRGKFCPCPMPLIVPPSQSEFFALSN